MKRVVLLLLTLAAVAAAGTQAASEQTFPATIRLPDGIQPEGIAIAGNTFYVGSIPTGAVYRGDLRTGVVPSTPLVPGGAGKAAIGVEANRGRLFVAGGPTGKAFVYSATDRGGAGDLPAHDERDLHQRRRRDAKRSLVHRLAEPGSVPRAARPERPAGACDGRANRSLQRRHRVCRRLQRERDRRDSERQAARDRPEQHRQALHGDAVPESTNEIDLGGGNVLRGDGILLTGKTLYVVQNRDNKIAKIALSARLDSGRITGYITDPDFDVPTTIDDLGSRLYAVNARFGTPPTPTTRYDVVQVAKR